MVPVAEKQAGSQPDRLLLSGTLKQQFWELEVAGENPCKTVTQAVRVHHQQWQSLCLMPPVPPWRLSAAPMAPETVAPLVVPPVVPQPLAPRLVPAIVSQVLPRSAGDCVAGIAEESAGDYDAGKVCEELSLTYRCRSTHALSDVKVRLYVPTVRLIEYTYSRVVAPRSWH